MYKIFIDGSEGTTGLKIAERLTARKDIELLAIKEEYRKDLNARSEKINSADAVFLCLPDAAAKESVSKVTNPGTVIIDTSTAHRCDDLWTYGFPELSQELSDKIKKSKRIAVPGCHATGFVAIVAPLVKAGVLPEDYPLTCHSVTGYSGGGKKMIAEYGEALKSGQSTDSNGLFSPRQYALGQSHKHLPEMVKYGGITFAPVFNPIVSNFYSGMAVSVPLHARFMNNEQLAANGSEIIFQALQDHYEGKPLITVTKEDERMLAANELSGTCKMRINVSGNNDRITVTALLDNLGKGASGAAMQCMNIALGLGETIGL